MAWRSGLGGGCLWAANSGVLADVEAVESGGSREGLTGSASVTWWGGSSDVRRTRTFPMMARLSRRYRDPDAAKCVIIREQ